MSQIIDLTHLHKNAGQQSDTPALDYERAKDFFWAKLADDRHGHGRMESAFFHTAQWIFKHGCHERDQLLARIAAQDIEANTLRGALQAHGVEAARLVEQRDELLLTLKAARNWLEGWASAEPYLSALNVAIAKAEAGHA